MVCSRGQHNGHLSPLISGHLGQWWATGNRARGLAEALHSIMNGVKAKSTRLRMKLKGTVPGGCEAQSQVTMNTTLQSKSPKEGVQPLLT